LEILRSYLESWPRFLPFLFVLIVTIVVARAANYLLRKRQGEHFSRALPRQLIVLGIVLLGTLVAVLVMPIGDTSRKGIFSLLSIGLTAIVAISSTTLVSNAMAGIMLRAVKSFHDGDFISVNDQFGRVTGRGLFHTEIQTEFRDLTTIPNSLLVSHPVVVVRSSGTIISATVSLGYDNARSQIESLLLQAAESAGLSKGFVQVERLGDFSVVYRVAGFLDEPKTLLTARSKLRMSMLDTLQDAGVEIVSPTFMNQRQLQRGERFLARSRPSPAVHGVTAEEVAFDKADRAEDLAELKHLVESSEKQLEELRSGLKEAQEPQRARLERELEAREAEHEALQRKLAEEVRQEERRQQDESSDGTS
jgi:small-conductance mechanosensitive channel